MRVQQAVLPGILLGCVLVFGLSLGISKSSLLHASTIASGQVSSRYPEEIRHWEPMIAAAAADFNLDPNLIAAMILQESGGDADIVSGSGAIGLMQVMPRDGVAATFMCPNGPCFASRPSTTELLDPSYNIHFGAEMLSGMIYRYGDTREALKAYGPQDVGYRYADIVLQIYENYR